MATLSAREVSEQFVFGLIKSENELYTKIKYFMTKKGEIGEKLMIRGLSQSQIARYYEMSKFLDSEIEPLASKHQLVVDQLRRFGVVVKHN